MKDNAFVDTNIFIYLYSADEIEKRNICLSAIRKFDCITSTQALNELSNVFTRKWKLPISDIKKVIDEISSCCKVAQIDPETIKKALDIHGNYRFSYYDSLMLSAAIMSDCKYILTEDMKNQQVIDRKLKIVNIFKTAWITLHLLID